MSFIQSTIKCRKCQFEMNVSTGTFGGGIPKKCPKCNDEPLTYETMSSGWNAEDNPILNPIPTTIKAREKLFDEKFSAHKIWVVPSNDNIQTIEELKSFNHESYNELLRAMVETAEGMKGLPYSRDKFNDERHDWANTGYNTALSTLQDKIKSYIK